MDKTFYVYKGAVTGDKADPRLCFIICSYKAINGGIGKRRLVFEGVYNDCLRFIEKEFARPIAHQAKCYQLSLFPNG